MEGGPGPSATSREAPYGPAAMASRPDTAPRAWGYILASRRNGTLYVGSTTDLSRRVWEHKNHLTPGFTSDYGVHIVVENKAHSACDNFINCRAKVNDVVLAIIASRHVAAVYCSQHGRAGGQSRTGRNRE